jgi:hypothetical protein
MSNTKRDNAKAKAKKLPWGNKEKYELLEEAHGPNYFAKECKGARQGTERKFRRACGNVIHKLDVMAVPLDGQIIQYSCNDAFPKVPKTEGWETH